MPLLQALSERAAVQVVLLAEGLQAQAAPQVLLDEATYFGTTAAFASWVDRFPAHPSSSASNTRPAKEAVGLTLTLGRLPHRTGVAVRYPHVPYHASQQDPVDVVVYRGPGFRDAWFLMLPPDSGSWLPTEQVVALYRQRMQMEHCRPD